jgi:hypothetical protein
MKVSELYESSPLRGQDVFIVGTGPSMDVFPLEFLYDKKCILLNDAQRNFRGLGPVAFSNHLTFLEGCDLPIQVVKARHKYTDGPERTDNHCPWDHPRYHCFSYRQPPWDDISHNDERTLWREPDFYWSPKKGSVSAFAVQFALHCGVRSICLVGCDCNALDGQHYTATKEKTSARHVYQQYAAGLMRLRIEAHKRGVPLLSLNPFFGLGWHAEQFHELQNDRRQRFWNGLGTEHAAGDRPP